MAHIFGHVRADRYVAGSGALLLFYAGGAVAGPVLAAFAMSLAGPAGFFMFTGGMAALAAFYSGYRMLRSAPVDVGERTAFVTVPRTTPVGARLDPRTPPDEAGDGRPE